MDIGMREHKEYAWMALNTMKALCSFIDEKDALMWALSAKFQLFILSNNNDDILDEIKKFIKKNKK